MAQLLIAPPSGFWPSQMLVAVKLANGLNFFFALEALAQTFSSVRNSRLKYEPRPGLLFVGVNVVLYTATWQKIECKSTLSIVNLKLI